jgi:hypothetical protein
MADYDDASKKSGVRRVSVADGTFVSNGVAPDGMLNGLSMSPDGRQLAVESGVAKTESWVLENFLRGGRVEGRRGGVQEGPAVSVPFG